MTGIVMEEPALRLNMLVVDDDDLDRERVRRFLKRSSLEVELTEAASGAEALNLVRSRVFDCVVLDNQLGDTDGAALLPRLRREARQDFPIIFITGAGNESLAVHVMQDGAADYLAKSSLNAEALVRSIRRSVETHRLQCENERLREELESRVEIQAATIRQGERDLRALVDNTPYLIGCWDASRRCRFGNRTHAEWFGVEAERLAGTSLAQLLGPSLEAVFEIPVQRVLSGQACGFECRMPGRDGRGERTVQVQLVPDRDEVARVQGFYLSISDVGPQKATQARIEDLLAFSDAVIEHSPIGIAVFGPDGGCVRANVNFLDLLGEPLEALQHLDCRQRPSWRACGLAQAAAATLANAVAQRADYTLPLPGRDPVELDCAMARVDRDGVPHLLLIARDIGEQRRSHAALVHARDEAQSAARTKSSFLANMSHEIRTPMNAIVGLSRLALETEVPSLAHAYVQKVHHASIALMGLLDDVLDYSKLEAGHLRVERTVVDLEDMLQRVAELFEARIEQQDLAFGIEFEPGVARHVWGDGLRLSQILNNLVGNAIKFTPTGGIRLRVRSVSTPPRPGHATLRFEVEDTGIGIAPEVRARLFDAFVQADDSITRRFGGTGLGLAICRALVNLMGGHIGVDSVPGRGSCFWFTLTSEIAPAPAVPGPGAALAQPAPTPRVRIRELAQPLQGMRLLVVEDNPLNRIVASELLKGAGLEVSVAADGLEGVRVFAESLPGHFGAILMDLHMPGLDGIEATRQIRALAHGRLVPIIALTAAAMPEDRERCLAAGMTDHLSKPVLPEQCIQVLLRARAGGATAPAFERPPEPVRHGIDVERLVTMLGGNRPLAARLLGEFVEREGDAAQRLGDMIGRGEREAAKAKAHDLKGCAGSIGAVDTSAAAGALQHALNRGEAGAVELARLASCLRADLGEISGALARLA